MFDLLNLFYFYKALDAYCLVEIFDYFLTKLNQFNISFEMTKAFGKKFKNTQNIPNTPKVEDSPKKIEKSNKIEQNVN